jgi:hypothetical protein
LRRVKTFSRSRTATASDKSCSLGIEKREPTEDAPLPLEAEEAAIFRGDSEHDAHEPT